MLRSKRLGPADGVAHVGVEKQLVENVANVR